ncbi:MAG: OmpH family outer membrane protein [Polaribacter sp.]
MKSKILFLFIAFLSTMAIAQTKLGTIDSDYIINIMPESKTVIKLQQSYGAKLDSSFNSKVQDFKVKLDDYKEKEKTMGPLLKKTTQIELAGLEQDIKKYKKNGTMLVQLKRDELMRPLYKKLNIAIDAVAKANGYTQILTTKGNQFAYIDAKFDITDLVIKKLGITVPKVKK